MEHDLFLRHGIDPRDLLAMDKLAVVLRAERTRWRMLAAALGLVIVGLVVALWWRSPRYQVASGPTWAWVIDTHTGELRTFQVGAAPGAGTLVRPADGSAGQ